MQSVAIFNLIFDIRISREQSIVEDLCDPSNLLLLLPNETLPKINCL